MKLLKKTFFSFVSISMISTTMFADNSALLPLTDPVAFNTTPVATTPVPTFTTTTTTTTLVGGLTVGTAIVGAVTLAVVIGIAEGNSSSSSHHSH